MTRLNGKTAVITGGATGIGLAAAKRFIEEGAFVFIFGRRQEALDAAVAELGPNARAVKGSVSDEADLDRLYAAVKAERGTLDIVFANAGVGSQLKLGEITAKHIDETFDINVKGTIFTVQKALPLMGKGGSIILTGSSAGTTGAPAFTAYSASKAAVRNLARTWAEDLKGTGIRVNVLSPGAMATELAKAALGEEGLKAYGSMTALQRMGDPAEIGAAAAFLASSDSSFMTASEVAVDGGLAQTLTRHARPVAPAIGQVHIHGGKSNGTIAQRKNCSRYRGVAGHWPRHRRTSRERWGDGRADLQRQQIRGGRGGRGHREGWRHRLRDPRATSSTRRPSRPCSRDSTTSSPGGTEARPSTFWSTTPAIPAGSASRTRRRTVGTP